MGSMNRRSMLDRMGIRRRDRRNLGIVVVVMALILTVIAEGPLAVRFVVGAVGGLFAGLVFIVVTVLINAYM